MLMLYRYMYIRTEYNHLNGIEQLESGRKTIEIHACVIKTGEMRKKHVSSVQNPSIILLSWSGYRDSHMGLL